MPELEELEAVRDATRQAAEEADAASVSLSATTWVAVRANAADDADADSENLAVATRIASRNAAIESRDKHAAYYASEALYQAELNRTQ